MLNIGWKTGLFITSAVSIKSSFSRSASLTIFIDPDTLKVARALPVTANQQPVYALNELEYIHGKIFANIWPTAIVLIISPETGKVVAWLDLKKLYPAKGDRMESCANGIAFDAENNTLLVTGKNWQHLFVLKLR